MDKTEVLAFDLNGRLLATGSWDKTVRLWDLDHPEAEPRILAGHAGAITTLAFDPAGRQLASGSQDHTARLWPLVDPGLESVVLRGHQGHVRALTFDPQGRWLATGSEDGTVRLWQLDIRVLLEQACRLAGRNLLAEGWREHLGDLPYQVTCPQFPSGEGRAGMAPPAP